uniref:2OG-Fe dioxygenase family protein n=1 Tax=uncultured bacterium 888 TaxID=548896 RepID=B8R8R0_9BACT|nr:hypothetical protein [uncultured bacterium 888]
MHGMTPTDFTRTDAVTDGELRDQILRDGFAFVPAAQMQALLAAPGQPAALKDDWQRFASSWNDLVLDTYLPEGHGCRLRRHATLSARAGQTSARIEPHQPHYQSVDYNPLLGGIQRWFEPIGRDVLEGSSMQRILAFCCAFFGAFKPDVDWHIECHQFRIEARRGAPGQPTPEGVHRDGVDYVLVLLIDRTNIASGMTTMHDFADRQLGSFTLSTPLDAALVDDARVKHGVTPVEPIDPAQPAYRDVLVVTLRAK